MNSIHSDWMYYRAQDPTKNILIAVASRTAAQCSLGITHISSEYTTMVPSISGKLERIVEERVCVIWLAYARDFSQ